MMKKITLFLMALLCLQGMVAQNRVCGTMQHHEYLKQTRPNYEAELAQYEQMISAYMNSPQAQQRTSTVITIPVVIHVVYNTTAQNISDAQAISQLTVLNNDFQKLNADTNLVPALFKPKTGGVNFTFCLAQRDPSGNPTTGVVHKQTTLTSFGTDDKVKKTSQGGDDAWDVTKYMNIWICPLQSPLLGYGEFPTTSLSNTYGLVINYTAAGTMGTAQSPFNKGRTGTHEFGHCFNLIHIWGDDSGCTGNDQCNDTPNQKSENYGTPTYPQGTAAAGGCCSAGDVSSMYMNYMDYVDDAAMMMFTQNQCTRMLAVVSNPPWNILQSSNGCTPLVALDASLLNVLEPVSGISICNSNVTPRVVLSNSGATTITSAVITYKMDAGANQIYNWSGSLASGASATITLNAFTGLSAAAHTFSAAVSLPNGQADQLATNNVKTSTFTVTTAPAGAALPFSETFESTTFVPAGWLKTSANTLNATNTWTRVTNNTGIPVTPLSTACARMDNYSGNTDITGQRDALRSPALSFVGANSSLKLKFDVAYRRFTSGTDSLNVWISTDCGSTWTRIYNKGGAGLATVATTIGSAFTPTTNAQWRRDSVSLSAYVGQPSVYLKFESVSGYSNLLYLDNINVKSTAAVAAPTASFTAASTSVCAGTSLQLTDQSTNAPTSWTWTATSSTGVTFSSANAQNPTVSFANAGTYTVSLSAANAVGSASTNKIITVNALPTLSIVSPTVCSGQAGTITVSGASTYSWSTGATTSSISASPAATTNYTVRGTSAAGCVRTSTTSITVKATPTVAVASASVCQGSAASLSASGATTYSWSTTATTASISVSPTVTTVYTVTGTTNGCSSSKTTTLTVSALPNVAAASPTICSGTTASLSASGATTYSWSTGATGASISVSPAATVNYTVRGSSAAGCAKTITVTVTVKATPTLAVASASVCQGSAATLSASGATTYSWSTSATTASISVSPISTTSYTLRGTTNGCTATSVVTVTVNALPMVSVNSATICAGGNAQLTASGASSYTWSTGASGAGINVSPVTTTTYTLIGQSAAGCSKTASATVVVTTAPVLSVNSATICAGATATLTASGVSSYTWSNGSGNASISVNPAATTIYTVSGSASGCPGSSVQTSTVSVNPNPTVSFASIQGPLCNTSPAITLNGTPAGGTFGGTGVSGSSFDPGAAGAGSFTLSYVYMDANNCSGSDSQAITVANCTGVEELSTAGFQMYPNPAQEVVYLRSMTGNRQFSIAIYDAIGKLVYTTSASDELITIHTASLAKGLYTLYLIENSGKQGFYKFVKD